MELSSLNESRNGLVKLIHALSLARDADLPKSLVFTLGYIRQKEPADLTAVVEARAKGGDETAAFSQRILEEADVHLVPLSELDEYAQSVRRELSM